MIVGFGPTARAVARALDLVDMAYVITTPDPDAGRSAELDGRKVVQGDITRRYIFELAGVSRARLVVIPDDEPGACAPGRSALSCIVVGDRAGQVGSPPPRPTSSRRAVSSNTSWPTRPRRPMRCCRTSSAGWRCPSASSTPWSRTSSAPRRFARPDAVAMAPGMIVRTHVDGEACEHVERIRAVTPGAAGCEECLRDHDRWVHLRLCLVCGHVGCCDSSPHRHARAHHAETGHPIARSMEVGEFWAWCFEHRMTSDAMRESPPSAISRPTSPTCDRRRGAETPGVLTAVGPVRGLRRGCVRPRSWRRAGAPSSRPGAGPTCLTHQARASERLRATPASIKVSRTRRSSKRSRVMTGTEALVKISSTGPQVAPHDTARRQRCWAASAIFIRVARVSSRKASMRARGGDAHGVVALDVRPGSARVPTTTISSRSTSTRSDAGEPGVGHASGEPRRGLGGVTGWAFVHGCRPFGRSQGCRVRRSGNARALISGCMLPAYL